MAAKTKPVNGAKIRRDSGDGKVHVRRLPLETVVEQKALTAADRQTRRALLADTHKELKRIARAQLVIEEKLDEAFRANKRRTGQALAYIDTLLRERATRLSFRFTLAGEKRNRRHEAERKVQRG